MPHDERDWSTVNVRHDGHHAQTTVYKPWKSKNPVFRSWVTYDARMPEPLHEMVNFDHPKVTRTYFEVQRALAAMQGQGNLWLAGMHMHDIDSHESALVSAVRVVQSLSPSAPRLATLAPDG
jgi:predicted NAD/FAD-binding protein